MVVGVREEACVDLHLALEDRLELLWHIIPGRDLLMPLREVGILRDDAQLLLPGEGALALLVPAVGEVALVLLDPLLGHVMRGVRRAGAKYMKNGLSGTSAFC